MGAWPLRPDHFLAGLGSPGSQPLRGPWSPGWVEGARTRVQTVGRAAFPGQAGPLRQEGEGRLAPGVMRNESGHGCCGHEAQTLSAPGEAAPQAGARASPGGSLSKTQVRRVSIPLGLRVTDTRVPSGPRVLFPGPEPRQDGADVGQALGQQIQPALLVPTSWQQTGWARKGGGRSRRPPRGSRGSGDPWRTK